ncbi:hypothetical protein TYRP_006998 [Tyrophagus putrescentiae]|nr:hypothetical protein TYRP_006998 [Tyrophagus putrescentiae]
MSGSRGRGGNVKGRRGEQRRRGDRGGGGRGQRRGDQISVAAAVLAVLGGVHVAVAVGHVGEVFVFCRQRKVVEDEEGWRRSVIERTWAAEVAVVVVEGAEEGPSSSVTSGATRLDFSMRIRRVAGCCCCCSGGTAKGSTGVEDVVVVVEEGSPRISKDG